MDYPFVSIIIPTYRDWLRLSLCLDALLLQSYPQNSFEILVVNNDPADRPPHDYRMPANSILIDEDSPGSYAARNTGLKMSKGEIVGFTDSDCIPDKNWLQNAIDIFLKDNNRDVGVVTGKIELFYINPHKLTAAEVYEKHTAFPTEAYAKGGHCVTANWFSYKSVIDMYGPFNANLKSGGDMALSKAISQDLKIVYSANVIINHPARSSRKEITKKMVRVLGGKYEDKYKRRAAPLLKGMVRSAFQRWKSVIKLSPKIPLSESLKMLSMHNSIILGNVIESFNLIVKKQKSKR